MNSLAANFKNFGVISIGAIALAFPLRAAQTVSHYRATWTFSEERQTGIFANGEPWVVGPVSLVAVSPDNNTKWNESYPGEPGPNSGSMRVTVPNSLQGYLTKSKAIPGYDNSKVYTSNLDLSRIGNLPAVLLPGEMIMTSIGQAEAGDVRSSVNEICVLTILSEAPPAGSFRPSLFSTTPRVVQFNKSDINFSILKNLARVPATPSVAAIELMLPALPWFEFDNTWLQSSFGPANNFATSGGPLTYPNAASGYGREIAIKWGRVALWLNTANTQAVKEKAMIQAIQCGLDIASFIRHGGAFYSDGGHKIGRKFPMLLAGLALNDPEILAIVADQANPRFSEDQSTFIVELADVGRTVNGGVDAQFTQADVGLADWGIRHSFSPQNDDRRWGAGGVAYRYVTWPAMLGCVLAADLMEQRKTWNHPAIFAYNERFKDGLGLSDGFESQMWSRFKQAPNGEPSAPQGLRIKR